MPAPIDYPLNFTLLAWMTLINLAIGLTNVSGWTITIAQRLLTKEGAKFVTREADRSKEESLDAAKNTLDQALGSAAPLGKVLGIIERELYLYALVANVTALFAAVVLFKAFSSWLSAGSISEQGKVNIVLYTGYAIATFISLAWALVIFEAVKLAR